MASEWTKYICKSGETLFIYNKITGEHRWLAKCNSESLQDNIRYGEPILHKEQCNMATQTDDYGCGQGCSSMYISTGSKSLSEHHDIHAPNADCHSSSSQSIENHSQERYVNGTTPLESGRSLVNNPAVDTRAPNAPTCPQIMEKCSQERYVNGTTRLESGRSLVNNPVDTRTPIAPTCPQIMENSSQERYVNGTTPLVIGSTVNAEYGANVIHRSLVNNVGTQVPSAESLPNSSESVGHSHETHANEPKHLVITNVFSYATGDVFVTHQESQKVQYSIGDRGSEEKRGPSDCFPRIDSVISLQGQTHPSSLAISLGRLQGSTQRDKADQSSSLERLQGSTQGDKTDQSSSLERLHGTTQGDKTDQSSSLERLHGTTQGDKEDQSVDQNCSVVKQEFQCSNCNKSFSSRVQLSLHLRTHTEERLHKCSYCDKTFQYSGSLFVHQRMHTGEKPYRCSYCDKTFRHNSSLTVHLKLHTGEKPYKCSSCDKMFRQKIHLRNHLRTHTTEKQCRYKCSHCDEEFRHNSELVIHLLSHSGLKPYRCLSCDRLFSQKSHLNNHEQTHCRKKADKCSYCDKEFKFGSSLTLHLRTHTGEKPYKCSLCDMTFRQKQHLIVHVRRHTGEKPFICPHCSKAFRHDTGLRSHLLIHPESHYSIAQAAMYTEEQLNKTV